MVTISSPDMSAHRQEPLNCEIYNNYLTQILTQALQMLFLFPEQMENRLKELMSSTL